LIDKKIKTFSTMYNKLIKNLVMIKNFNLTNPSIMIITTIKNVNPMNYKNKE